MIDLENVESAPRVFKYKGLRGDFVWLVCFVVPSCLLFFVGSVKEHSVELLVYGIIFFALFFVCAGYLLVVVQTDIVIGEDGISRRIGNKTLQIMAWNEVRVIKAFDTYDRETKKMSIGLNIYPISKPKHRLTLSGKIVVSEAPMRQGTFSELVELLNIYIAQNHIEIESTVQGVKSYPSHL